MYSILVSPPVETDIREIRDYYDNFVYGLGENFILKFNEVLELLESHPKLYPIIENEIRRTIMSGFPYAIFYSLEENYQALEILAVIHTSRNPEYWKTRIPLSEL